MDPKVVGRNIYFICKLKFFFLCGSSLAASYDELCPPIVLRSSCIENPKFQHADGDKVFKLQKNL